MYDKAKEELCVNYRLHDLLKHFPCVQTLRYSLDTLARGCLLPLRRSNITVLELTTTPDLSPRPLAALASTLRSLSIDDVWKEDQLLGFTTAAGRHGGMAALQH